MKINFLSWFLPGGFFCPGVAAAVVGAGVLGAGASIYSADKARSSANSQADQARQLALLPRSTQYGSSVNPSAGTSIIDPSIRGMREASLSGIPGYKQQYSNAIGSLNSGLGGILGQLQSNQNPFMQARVNPLLQQQAQQQGALATSNNLRGIAGSSFGNQAMTNLNTDYGRAIGDQGALATQESLGAQTGIMGNLYTANVGNIGQQFGMDQQYSNVADQNLAQELSALGLSQADVGSILGANSQSMAANQNYLGGLGRSLSGLGSSFAGIQQQQQYPGVTSPIYNPGYGGAAYGGSSAYSP